MTLLKNIQGLLLWMSQTSGKRCKAVTRIHTLIICASVLWEVRVT